MRTTFERENVRLFTMLHTDFLDYEGLSSNEKVLMAILMRYSKGESPGCFPSLTGLAKKAGMARRVVCTTLKSLEEKNLVCRKAHYVAGKNERAENIYIVRDDPFLWKNNDKFECTELLDNAIEESIGILQFAGYVIVKKKKASSDDVAAPKEDESLSQKISKEKRPFTIIYNDFLDYEGLNSKEKIIAMLLMRYGATRKESTAFPSISDLAKKSGMSERSVQYVLKKLVKKNILTRKARFKANGGQSSNVYIIKDNPLLWNATNLGEIQETITKEEISKIIELMNCLGYSVRKETSLEKVGKKKASSDDVAAPKEDESLSQKISNSINKDTLFNGKSQEQNEKKVEYFVTGCKKDCDTYSMDWLKGHLGYKNICANEVILHDGRLGPDAVDAAFAVIYDVINSKTKWTSVGKEAKTTAVVTSKFLKLSEDDIVYALQRYASYPYQIHDCKKFILRNLYFAKEERVFSRINEQTMVSKMFDDE